MRESTATGSFQALFRNGAYYACQGWRKGLNHETTLDGTCYQRGLSGWRFHRLRERDHFVCFFGFYERIDRVDVRGCDERFKHERHCNDDGEFDGR